MISFKVTFLGHTTSWLSNILLVQETIFAKKIELAVCKTKTEQQ